MRAGVLLCLALGHRYGVDPASQAIEPVLLCSRCGRKILAPNTTGFEQRVQAQTGQDNALGPGRRGR